MSTKHLWEFSHPYYCTEGCFFYSPRDHGDMWTVHTDYESWDEFMESWGESDLDMNLVFRWDWCKTDPSDYEYEIKEDPTFEIPGDTLKVYFYLQRKGYGHSVYVDVTEEDESAVRVWLTERAEHMKSLWEPLLWD